MTDLDKSRIIKDHAYKIVVVGHVDHGKSTLLAQMLIQLGCVPEDRIEKAASVCRKLSTDFEPAFLLDALEEEQEQAVSIETTRVALEYNNQNLLFIDAPGHLSFLRNATTGASGADLGLLVVAAPDGIKRQTIKHLKLLKLLGIEDTVVAINKLDEVDYKERAFSELVVDLTERIASESLQLRNIVPISALSGENLIKASLQLPWYTGKPLLATLLEESLRASAVRTLPADEQPLRIVVQNVMRLQRKRYLLGRVLSGSVKPGDAILFSPSGQLSQIASIARFPDFDLKSASAGDAIAIILAEEVYVEWGEVASRLEDGPAVDNELIAEIVWLSDEPLSPSAPYLIKIGTSQVECTVHPATEDAVSLDPAQISSVATGDFAYVRVRTVSPLAFDRHDSRSQLNRFVLCTQDSTVAAGAISARSPRALKTIAINPHLFAQPGLILRQERERAHGHRGSVVWLTGLSGSGKSTLAKQLEHALFKEGYRAITLDADNVRLGLNADLGFSPEDRSENIRRIAHVARILLNSGAIVLVAAIAPYEHDRQTAKAIIGPGDFLEVFLYCPLDIARKRDKKGLYQKASSGQLTSMTGISAPYQLPHHPHLRLDTSKLSTLAQTRAVLDLLQAKEIIPRARIHKAKGKHATPGGAR